MNTSKYLCKRCIKCPSPLVSHQRPPGHMKPRENHEKDKKRSWCAGCSGQVSSSPPQHVLLCVPAPGPKSKPFWRKPPLSCYDSASSQVLLKEKKKKKRHLRHFYNSGDSCAHCGAGGSLPLPRVPRDLPLVTVSPRSHVPGIIRPRPRSHLGLCRGLGLSSSYHSSPSFHESAEPGFSSWGQILILGTWGCVRLSWVPGHCCCTQTTSSHRICTLLALCFKQQ